jgi:hypothetical protein
MPRPLAPLAAAVGAKAKTALVAAYALTPLEGGEEGFEYSIDMTIICQGDYADYTGRVNPFRVVL